MTMLVIATLGGSSVGGSAGSPAQRLASNCYLPAYKSTGMYRPTGR